jgi:predicted GNAT family N-acyltransferase
VNRLVIEEAPFGSARYEQATELRRELLRKPLGLDFTPEELSREASDTHLAALADGRVVGTLLLRAVDPQTSRIMRMAVAADVQRRNVGRALVEAAEDLLRSRGIFSVMMHARATAVGFYEKCGYRAAGEPFPEQGIAHVRMQKRLG